MNLFDRPILVSNPWSAIDCTPMLQVSIFSVFIFLSVPVLSFAVALAFRSSGYWAISSLFGADEQEEEVPETSQIVERC